MTSRNCAREGPVLADAPVRRRPLAPAVAPGAGDGGRRGADRRRRARLADLRRPDGRFAMATPARPREAAAHERSPACAAILGLGLAVVALRYGLFRGIVRFTLRMMSEVARATFWRVQRFSTDWHANSFAGSTVRKLTRGMWAFDMFNDTVLDRAAGRRCVVLVGATLLFGWHWPVMGLVVGVERARLRGMTAKLSLDYVTPATPAVERLGHAHRRRVRGRGDLQSVVKAFGAETARMHASARPLAMAQAHLGAPGAAPPSTAWSRGASSSCCAAVIGARGLFWWQGTATPGDVIFVLTTYVVINGYLRDVGHHVHNFQRVDERAGGDGRFLRPGARGREPSGRTGDVVVAARSRSSACASAIRRTAPALRDLSVRIRPASASASSDGRARARRPSSS